MTIRGGGAPSGSMAFRPQWRMDPPLRSFAADAYYCIMVWILWIRRIQVCGAMVCALWRVPLGSLCTEPKPGAEVEQVELHPAPLELLDDVEGIQGRAEAAIEHCGNHDVAGLQLGEHRTPGWA